jgi:hypothetical protein
MKSIIEMAKQAGFGIDESPCVLQPYVIQPLHGKIDDELTRFAHLVRAAALEEAAGVCENVSFGAMNDWSLKYKPLDQGREIGAGECAAAIRALAKEKT